MIFPEKTDGAFLETFTNSLFTIDSTEMFDKMTLEAFRYQYKNNCIYKKYTDLIHISPSEVEKVEDIPFLPIEFFRYHKIIAGKQEYDIVFGSSGTTDKSRSKHYIKDVKLYEMSFKKSFEHFYGNVMDYCILALLPSYKERDDSSLIYMVHDLIKKSCKPYSGFFLNNTDELIERLNFLHSKSEKILLIGVSFALLDLIEKYNISVPGAIIMETGGMKGKREEIIKPELHKKLCEGFSLKQVHSEYGMTELLSQAYSKGNGIFHCPPWMKVVIRDIHAPSSVLGKNKTGGINVIDLANINSCCFIETSDLGKIFEDNSFEVLGRMDNSDIRGCNLLVNN